MDGGRNPEGGDAKQVWAASIPCYLTEDGVRSELAAYGVHPRRIYLHQRGVGKDRRQSQRVSLH